MSGLRLRRCWCKFVQALCLQIPIAQLDRLATVGFLGLGSVCDLSNSRQTAHTFVCVLCTPVSTGHGSEVT